MTETDEAQVNPDADSDQETPLGRIDLFIARLVEKVKSRSFQKQLLWTFGSIVLALLVSAVIMALTGRDPLTAFRALALGALTQMDLVMRYATPLILTGLSVALAFRCGLFNIGPEGQLLMGGIVAAIFGFMVSMPIIVHPLVCLAVGALAGAAWGFVPGILKAYRGAHEVVTSMMLSYTAALLTQWLVTYPLKEQGPYAWISQTPRLNDTALLPSLFDSDYMHFGLIVAILCVIGVDFLINRTVLGYELRAVGFNQKAAEYSGINPKKNIALAMTIAGGLAGLAGAEEIMGTYGRFTDNWTGGLGWDGITVAVLGNNHPWGVLAGAIFFGALRAGGGTMQQQAGVPAEMVSVIQGLIVMFVAAPRIVDWLARHNVDYVRRMKEMPMISGPAYALVVLNFLSIFFAFGGVLEGIMAQSFLLFLVAMAALAGFILTLSKNPRGNLLSTVTYIGWLVIAAIGFIMAAEYSVVPLVVGSVGLLLSIINMRISAASLSQDGGEP
ncbi:MAG: ABC transporter permease [Candidatus Thorarchaeota archaeon]|nr:ABC transporter permease [Candidatus Thorarchaeota archaeon]